MANFNKVVLAGRLTKDPEFKTVGETNICNFSIAVSEFYKDKETTNFIDVTAFGNSAKLISEHLTKGRSILVEGKLRQEKWEDKTSNEKRSKLVVILDTFQFLSDKPQDSNNEAPAAPKNTKAETTPAPQRRGF